MLPPCVQIADPEDGCTAMRTPEGLQDRAWIPMIVRSERLHTNCTFDDKVRLAYALHEQVPAAVPDRALPGSSQHAAYGVEGA